MERYIDPRIKPIIEFVLEYRDIPFDDVYSKLRKREVVVTRQIAMYFCRKYTELNLAEIGASIGGRDHSTVLYACNTIKDLIKFDKEFAMTIKEMDDFINDKVLPAIEERKKVKDYELEILLTNRLKRRTDIIRKKYEGQLVQIYNKTMLSLQRANKNIEKDATMEGFRKRIITSDINESIMKLREMKQGLFI